MRKDDVLTRQTQREKEREKVRHLFERYVVTRDEKVKEELVLHHMNLVRYLAGKFSNRWEPLDDLVQVGCVGLIKAIDRYDLSKGAEFTTYATPTIVGEIKRHFRDKGWAFKVPRRLQELNHQVSRAGEELGKDLGRSPTVAEIAGKVGATEEEVLEAQELGQAHSPMSLELEMEGDSDKRVSNLLDYLGENDLALEGVEDRISLEKAFQNLDSREQLVLYLRFYENMSQNEIAKHLKTLQMHVSRLQRRALEKLRQSLQESHGA